MATAKTAPPAEPGAAPSGSALRPSLLGATRTELEALAVRLGEPRFRGRQVFAGLFARAHSTFATMTDLPQRLRRALADQFEIGSPAIERIQTGPDGTRKYRFVGTDGHAFEAVYIPEVARGRSTNTLCLSSQSGCALGCRFCFTATLDHCRNLDAAEILGQVLAVRADLAAAASSPQVNNIVFMGMGEPLLNLDAVVRAVQILTDREGLAIPARRITISTAGVVPRLEGLGRALTTQLAVSLNATTDEVRDRIMPINRKWPIADLLAALRRYPLPPRRRITIEYVLLDGVNDSDEDARRLPQLLRGIPAKINLLPLNPHARTSFAPPPRDRVERFQSLLRAAGLNALLRSTRGREVAAACGQLGERGDGG